MTKIKQSISWWSFVPNKMTAEEFLTVVADSGYDGVELAPPEYWQMILDYGLEIAAVGGHESISDGLNRKENFDRISAEIQDSLENAVKLNIPNLICFSGNRAGLDDDLGAEITADALSRLAPKAERAGVTLILELLNSKRNHPDYQCDTTDWGAKVIKSVNSPRVKLLYDVYHMQVMEGNVVDTIQNNYNLIAHYHTAGCPGRNELDNEQELFYPAIFRAIARTGYNGYIGHEFIPRQNAAESIRSAHALCRDSLSRPK
ncbi:hydroxypyruvate isomerase family protein [Roseinatronobacter sp. S2]|uniref:hydroxypyruvate isomerase family protein n=1 Tax=Roseinatronobacter sp. S2 TaxID=3035471 RepID=UPI00240FB9CA|nr:TIM barrel protein [Roseinatronobacter sp. S2]WFE73365.1 TIM barrel protein [Roseinatronobacter sp. S2]